MQEIKVGDKVSWANVPTNALVRVNDEWGGHIIRRGELGDWSQPSSKATWFDFDALGDVWHWDLIGNPGYGDVTIIALGVPAAARPTDLQALAAAYDEAQK